MNADEIIDGLEEISSILPHSLIPNAAIDLIESLQAQLAKEKRRADRAVEDIMCNDHCDVCKFSRDGDDDCEKYVFDCSICESEKCVCRTCRNEHKWQWRGDAEEGDAK